MLAIIAYKNLFPCDFADLQLNKGFVYTLFNSKDAFISEELEKLSKKISEIVQKIAQANNEHLKTLEELNTVFEDKKSIRSWNRELELSEDDKKEYDERRQAIENRLNNDIPYLENEKLALEQEMLLTQNKSLCDIITRDNINTIFSITSTNEIGTVTDFNAIKSSEYFDLVKYLVRNGYIDETYADYMTYFYENSLTRIDKTFLRSVTDRRAKEYTYQLKNPSLVVSRLKLVDFDQEEVLNFTLLTHLLHTQTHIEYLERVLNQLKKTKNFNFISAYFYITTEMPAYIKYLNISWPEIFSTILDEKALTEKQIRKYSIFSIYYSDDNTIKLVNQDNCLCDYISNSRNYLAIDEPNVDKLIHGFNLLGVCFVGFDYGTLNKDLFHTVYEESLYVINAENLQLIQTLVLGIRNDEDIVHKNYTLLLSYPDSALTQYVNRNINKYFDVILQISGGTFEDDENIAITALNNSDLTVERKCSYISALQTTITFIKEITDNALWSPLLDADIVKYSERNIMDCFSALKLNDSVISYINRYNIDINFSNLEFDETMKEKLFNSVIICNSIENLKYERILVSLKFYIDNFNITDISNDKIAILINANIIRMTVDNLKFLRECYSSQTSHFIQHNIESYTEIMSSELFSQPELLDILTWDISDVLKIKLLEFCSDTISVIGKNYSTAVCLYILKNNFMNSDLLPLFSSFEQWEEAVQRKIFDYAVRNITSIIDNPDPVSKKLKDYLIHSNELSKDIRIDLLIAIFPDVGEDYIKEALALLDLTNYIRIFDTRRRPKYEISDESEKLLSAFKEKGLISNYEESQGFYKIVRTRAARPLAQELL